MGGCPRTFYSTGGLRTCPRHRRLLKLHAIYNPPLHLIAFLYSQLTPWYCFSKRVLRMKSIAFFVYGGCVNIFFHSTTPNGSLRRSSFHISCLRRLNFRHSIRTCRTVCEVWPHSQRLSSTIFRVYKNERSPIFPVLICTSKELCGFFSLVWIIRSFLLGCGTKIRRSFPLLSLFQDVFQHS